MPDLRFDISAHRYYLDGREVPSVTRVLSDLGLIPFASGMDSPAARRGSAVHEACRLDDLDRLDEGSVSPNVAGYLKGWRRFRKATPGITWDRIEEPVASVVHGYAGTPDRVGLIRDGEHVLPLVGDIKTGQPAPWHALQTAGYAHAHGLHAAVRASIYLGSRGTFRMVRHEDPADIDVFLAALTLRRWRTAN